MALELDWEPPLKFRRGSPTRLADLEVYYDFAWRKVFGHTWAQFPNGQCLAQLVRAGCPDGRTPALVLTAREDVQQRVIYKDSYFAVVVNIRRYLDYGGANPAIAYWASLLGPGLTLTQLHLSELSPEDVKTFLDLQLDAEHIAEWALQNPDRLAQLQEIAELDKPGDSVASVDDALAVLRALEGLDAEHVAAIAELFGQGADRTSRLELVRAITKDPTGRYVTGEVLVERTPDRVKDARDAMAAYHALLDDPGSDETAMQHFIEENLWLLGLDYAEMRARQPSLRGVMDFILERYDGFHDLLELKSPHDEIIRVGSTESGVPPSASAYRLSRDLSRALAQVHVYRDVLSHDRATEELLGLQHSRDPRLIVVIGKADPLPEHCKRVLRELNKSLHRVEIVPYDVLAKRANAILDNVERYLIAAGRGPV